MGNSIASALLVYQTKKNCCFINTTNISCDNIFFEKLMRDQCEKILLENGRNNKGKNKGLYSKLGILSVIAKLQTIFDFLMKSSQMNQLVRLCCHITLNGIVIFQMSTMSFNKRK